jgi:hypothetical protein
MQTRAARWVVFTVLVVIGIGAAALTWLVEQRVLALDAEERSVTRQIDRLIATVIDVGVAQEAYVAPGMAVQPWQDRVTSALQEIPATAQALRPAAQSVEAAPRLQAITDTTERLKKIDAGIRDRLAAGETLLASEAVFGEARPAVDAMTMSLRHLRDAESSVFLTRREDLIVESWAALGAAGIVWLIGLLALARRPRPAPVAHLPEPVTPTAPAAIEPASSPAPTVDLTAAADLCTDLSRIATTGALPNLLARAADLLDASGVIVWVGAGDELCAVSAHGYEARIVSRLGPIARSAENATAAAWRDERLHAVPGDVVRNGAIVAPMFGPDGCVGVLTMELRHGRETDATTQAVTSMIAAQLATAVAAWPAASTGTATV